MKLLADEHIPPAFVKALRGEGYDIVDIDETVGLGTSDPEILDYAIEQDRAILSEDTDFRGADPTFDPDTHPGILACDTAAKPGTIVAAVRRIDESSDDLTDTVLFVSGDWTSASHD